MKTMLLSPGKADQSRKPTVWRVTGLMWLLQTQDLQPNIKFYHV